MDKAGEDEDGEQSHDPRADGAAAAARPEPWVRPGEAPAKCDGA